MPCFELSSEIHHLVMLLKKESSTTGLRSAAVTDYYFLP